MRVENLICEKIYVFRTFDILLYAKFLLAFRVKFTHLDTDNCLSTNVMMYQKLLPFRDGKLL